MVFQVFVHIQGVQVFAVKTCKQHIYHNGNVNLVFVRIIFVAVFLVFDASLHILIIQVEKINFVACTKLFVVIGYNGFECRFLFFWILFVIFFLLR